MITSTATRRRALPRHTKKKKRSYYRRPQRTPYEEPLVALTPAHGDSRFAVQILVVDFVSHNSVSTARISDGSCGALTHGGSQIGKALSDKLPQAALHSPILTDRPSQAR